MAARTQERPAVIADVGQQNGDGESQPIGRQDGQPLALDQDEGYRDVGRAGSRTDRTETDDLPNQWPVWHQDRLATMTRDTPNGSVTRPSRCRSMANTAQSRRLRPAGGISSSALPDSPSIRPASRLPAISGNSSVLK